MLRWQVRLELSSPAGSVPVWRTDDPRAVEAVKSDLKRRLLRGMQDRRVPRAAREWARAKLEELARLEALAGEGQP